MALRTPLSVTPHLYMGDSTGRPLDKGVVYFGEQDKDPEFYPIELFSDDALTLPLMQPVHTKGGYLYDKGDMVEPHAKEIIYSVKVLDSYGRKVFYKGAMMRNSWNDDVIEQINTAIIESQAEAQVIFGNAATDVKNKAIAIVNDAINNTAIDGSILADTFVVKTANGVGQIPRSQRDKNAERISVHDFGAIGDGTLHTLQEWIDNGRYSSLAEIQVEHPTAKALTNSVDRVAIQTCIDYCKSIGATAYANKGKKYYIDDTLVVGGNIDFSESETTTPETFGGVVFYLGSNPDNPELLYDLRIKLPEIRTPRAYGSPWAEGSVGVKIEGMKNAVVYFDAMGGFETNLLLYSRLSNVQITANSFFFEGAFVGAKTNIKMLIEDAGWANQCQFYGGHFGVISTDSREFSDIRNIEMIKIGDGGNNPPNGHTFIGCNMEGGGFEYTIYQDYRDKTSSFLSNNKWISCRFEAAKKMLFDPKAVNDTMISPHMSADTEFVGTARPTIIGDYYRGYNRVFKGVTEGATRDTGETIHSYCANSGSSLVSTWGLAATQFNAGISASGSYQVFDNSNATTNYPILGVGKIGRYIGLYLGDGVEKPTERLYRYNTNDWRINFSISPDENNSVSLGKNGHAYSAVYSNSFIGTGSMGLWSVSPPTSKPVVTGDLTDGTALKSLLTALEKYGLITDSTV